MPRGTSLGESPEGWKLGTDLAKASIGLREDIRTTEHALIVMNWYRIVARFVVAESNEMCRAKVAWRRSSPRRLILDDGVEMDAWPEEPNQTAPQCDVDVHGVFGTVGA